ncbi:MAG: hypothetical protein HY686_09470 [Chloroflexi bacterium]|nr:hypothetical protein [Chloroflexota bacterium]
MTTEAGIRAPEVVKALKACGITHVVWLPDSETKFMYQALTAEKSLTLVPVCREGETMAVAAGLRIGGKEPAVLIQSTGFFESGDSIRGLVLDLDLPLLLLLGYRGFKREGPRTDSAAVFLEPILKAWGIDYYLLESESDVHRIPQAYQEAKARSRPMAVLICREYQ